MTRLLPDRIAGMALVMAVAACGLLLSRRDARGQEEKQAAPRVTSSPAGNVENGKKIYKSYGCWQCHGYEAHGGTGPKLGPNPISFPAFSRYTRQPTGQMPPYTNKVLSDKEMADIFAFVQTVPKPPDPKSLPQLND